ncbi:hypothetical protein RhiirA5_433829, partial [Rhizophagus irregularis]
ESISLQDEKQDFSSNLSEQLKQISQLNQEKNNLQDQLTQSKAVLKFQQDQYKNQVIQSQINYKKIEEENLIDLEKIAETNYQVSQNELKEMILAYQNIKLELANLQQQNFQLEQNYQELRFNSTSQIREFAEKENTLQTLITCLQNEKQALAGNLTEQLKQNKLTNQQIQNQTNQTEANIQELKSQQESLIEQKEQLENQLNQFQVNYEQIEQEKNRLHNVVMGLSQDQKLTTKLKAKLENEIAQLEQKLINEEQIKIQLAQALQIKENKINELEQRLINLDYERIKKLVEFQNILTKYNDGLLQLNKNFYSLRNIVQENKELEVSLAIENILKLDSFNLDKYKIFKFATNSQEGNRTQLNSSMMAEDIDSLRKNLNELKSEIKQEKKELKNLATD